VTLYQLMMFKQLSEATLTELAIILSFMALRWRLRQHTNSSVWRRRYLRRRYLVIWKSDCTSWYTCKRLTVQVRLLPHLHSIITILI